MKKDRINTSSIREIKHSFKRFLSLLVMSMLGVGVFVGIKMTAPDMMKSLDKYYDDNKQLMINYSLRGESEFSKLYKEKGSYNVSKKQKNNSDCDCTTFTPSHCDYHCADCGVRRG